MNTIVILSVTGIAAMMSDVFKLKKTLYGLSLLGLLIALVFSVCDWGQYASYFNQMVLTDNYAVVFTSMLIGMTFLWFLMSKDFFSSHSSASEHYALILFSLTGGVMMTNFSDLTILFLGLEILSISLYILAGSDKGNLFSNEASLKYFMIGSFATGFLLFGIALVYGATSTFNLKEISDYVQGHNGSLPTYFYAGILMILTGLTFKVSAVPFHFWAPDVYDGSPTLVTTYMLSVVKMAAFAALYRLFINCFAPVYEFWIPVFAIMSAVTMLLGNITAVYQKSLKRMLAYSSIAHAGYMLMALASPGIASKNALVFYLLAYAIATLGVFNVLYQVHKVTGREEIKSVKGLFRKNPFAAITLTLCMLSMAGIPPAAGFFGKYYMFVSTINGGLTWLVLIAVLSSLIGVYFYFKVIIAAFQEPELENTAYYRQPSDLTVLYICGILSLLLGILPQFVAGLL